MKGVPATSGIAVLDRKAAIQEDVRAVVQMDVELVLDQCGPIIDESAANRRSKLFH